MDKKQKRNAVIAIIGAVLLLVGVLVYSRTQKGDKVQIETPLESEVVKESSKTKTDGKSEIKPGVTENPETKELFNTAMRSGQNAYLAKKYPEALASYTKALTYKKSDVVYAGMYTVYSARGEWTKAITALDNAISLRSGFVEYYKWKIGIMDEHTNASYVELVKVYNAGLEKSESSQAVNLVTYFAGVAERNQMIDDAKGLWEKAIIMNPEAKTVYQAEIDRLSR